MESKRGLTLYLINAYERDGKEIMVVGYRCSFERLNIRLSRLHNPVNCHPRHSPPRVNSDSGRSLRPLAEETIFGEVFY